MKRLTDKRLALPPGVWQEVTHEQRMEMQATPVPSKQELYYRLFQIEEILCDAEDEYDLDRLAVMCNQRMTIREEVSQRFSLTKDIPLDRLRELVEADREGRCVVLPCRVGDTVYFVTGIYNNLVKPAKVEEIYIGDGSIALGVSTDFTTFTLQESEWYLTHAEADDALKAREQDDYCSRGERKEDNT